MVITVRQCGSRPPISLLASVCKGQNESQSQAEGPLPATQFGLRANPWRGATMLCSHYEFIELLQMPANSSRVP